MSTEGATRFIAPDESLAVDIAPAALAGIFKACSATGKLETGGVLLGRYSDFGDRVRVLEGTGPPSDSQRSAFAFVRGVAGLTKRFRRAWDRGIYYVGEWHLHPSAAPDPSPMDIRQISEVSRDPDYRCPHPVLVVIGGNPQVEWSVAVQVILGDAQLRLIQQREGEL